MNLKFLNLESVSCPSSEYMKVEMMSASEYRSAFSAVSGSLRNLMSCPCASLSKASRSHSSISKTASFIAGSPLGINHPHPTIESGALGGICKERGGKKSRAVFLGFQTNCRRGALRGAKPARSNLSCFGYCFLDCFASLQM